MTGLHIERLWGFSTKEALLDTGEVMMSLADAATGSEEVTMATPPTWGDAPPAFCTGRLVGTLGLASWALELGTVLGGGAGPVAALLPAFAGGALAWEVSWKVLRGWEELTILLLA